MASVGSLDGDHIQDGLRYSARDGLPLLLVRLFGFVHAPVGLGDELVGIRAVLREEGCTHANGNLAIYLIAGTGVPYEPPELIDALGDGALFVSEQQQDKLVSTHTGHVVVFAAVAAQGFADQAKEAIALEVPVAVVILLESVQVTDHHRE